MCFSDLVTLESFSVSHGSHRILGVFLYQIVLRNCDFRKRELTGVEEKDGGGEEAQGYATYEYSSALFAVRSMYCLSIRASIHFLIIPIDGANVTFDWLSTSCTN